MSIGIDCGGAKYAAVNAVDGQVIDFQEWVAPEDLPRGKALRLLGLELAQKWFSKSRLHDTWVEAPLVAGAKNLQSSLKVAQSTGVVQASLYNVREVAVSSWKKAVAGSGKLDKDGVREWLVEDQPDVYALLGHSQDLIDAYCIARYGDLVADNLEAALLHWH